MTKTRTAISLLLLYISKSGAVIVGVFILPWYQRLLGEEPFGVVAMVLSLQAFLVMLDLGTSTLVGRDVAAADEKAGSSLVTWRAAEFLLHGAYAALLILAIAINTIVVTPAPLLHVALCVLFFWALTVQNVAQSALLAKRFYALAAGTQMIGVLGRASITLSGLLLIEADLNTFFVAQAVSAVFQMVATSWLCRRVIAPSPTPVEFKPLLASAKELAIRGKPLVIFGLSGAAVLQLDKIIIPLFLSPTALSPYFLASALCLTPVSVLAGPITQYFQPHIIRSISVGDFATAQAKLLRLTLAIAAAVAIPSTLLWLARDVIVNLWLDNQPISAEVIRYVGILLPGIAVGALGFVPYTILVAHQDYRAQAILSATMTSVTLLATMTSAASGSIVAVCWVYAAYHSLSTVISWLRSTRLQPPPPHRYATLSARYALGLVALAFATGSALTLFSSITLP